MKKFTVRPNSKRITAAQQYTDKYAARLKDYYDHVVPSTLDNLCIKLEDTIERLQSADLDPYTQLAYDSETGEPLSGTPEYEIIRICDEYEKIQSMVKQIDRMRADVRDMIDGWN